MKKLLVALTAILALSGCAGMGGQPVVNAGGQPIIVSGGQNLPQPPMVLHQGRWVPQGSQNLGYGQHVAAGSINMGNLSMCQGLATAGGAVGGYVASGDKNQLPITILGGIAGYVLGNIFCPQSMTVVQQQGQVTQGANQRRVMTAPSKCTIRGETFEGLSEADCQRLGGMLGGQQKVAQATKELPIGTKRDDGKEVRRLNLPGDPKHGTLVWMDPRDPNRFPGE